MQTLVQMVYPPRCLACGGLVETDFALCGDCWKETPFIAGLTCRTCGVPLPGEDQAHVHCDGCLASPPLWSAGAAALRYEGQARRLVLALKHGDRHDIAEPAAQWMANATRPIIREGMIVLPIPLHLRRLLARRYNQAALLAKAMARILQLQVLSEALQRKVHTQSLDGQNRENRYLTVENAFCLNPRYGDILEGRSVLLVDDVMTSGATLNAAARTCLDHGASEVCVSVLARVARYD